MLLFPAMFDPWVEKSASQFETPMQGLSGTDHCKLCGQVIAGKLPGRRRHFMSRLCATGATEFAGG
jgi:hypothetical protein